MIRRQQLKHLAEYLVVRTFACVLQALRPETCAALARVLAWLCDGVLGVRRQTVDENLALAFPTWSPEKRARCRRRMWEHLFLFVAEVALAPRRIRVTNYREFLDFHDQERFLRHLIGGRGVVFVTAHFGVFEMLGFNAGLIGLPSYSVARNLDNPYLDAFIGRFRGATGQYLIPKDGGSEQLLAVLARGGIVGVIADQYAGSKGCWVDFFGHPASTHKAIALLSLANDAPLVVVSCRRSGNAPLRYSQHVHAEFDPRTAPPEMQNVRAVTQWFTSEFEKFIREAPEQYWWLHRRWKDNRPAKKRAKMQAA